MALETIVLRDPVARLHRGARCMRPARRNRTEHRFFVAKLQAHDSPRNLRFIAVRKNFEGRDKLRVRNQVRAHVVFVFLRVLRPSRRRFSIHIEYQDGMVRRQIGARVVRPVFVVANRHDHGRLGRCRDSFCEIFEAHSADPLRASEVRIAGNGERDLRQREQIVPREKTRGFKWKTCQFAAHFKIGRGLAGLPQNDRAIRGVHG